MEQQFRQPEAERLTPHEAEEVIKRFRDEEEQRQKEMEAQATNPTVADLAEGLGVPAERVARLLLEVRGGAVPPAAFRSEPITMQDAASVVRRSNQTAWIIAALIVGPLLVLAFLAILFLPSAEVRIEQPPPPFETITPVPDSHAPEPVTPESSASAGSENVPPPQNGPI